MKPAGLLRHAANLRVRVILMMLAGVLFAGVGFEVLLVTLTRRWLYQEVEYRTRSLAGRLADRAVTPLLLADTPTLAGEARRRDLDSDLKGIGFYDVRGRLAAGSADRPGLLSELGPVARGLRARHQDVVAVRDLWDGRVLEVAAPVLRRVVTATGQAPGEDALLGLPADRGSAPFRREQVGWARVVVSLERVDGAVATAGRMGFAVLALALLLGLVAISLLVRVMVRPLREASGLAREIAAGQLERRLPVRSEDELGALAVSLNTMASALLEARGRVEAEAQALRVATEAMVEIAKGVRTARDPARVFQVVAHEIRRVTGCDGVALAVPEGDDGIPLFLHLDPPLPWGELREPPVLDPELSWPAGATQPAPRRLVLAQRPEGLSQALLRQGFACALLVPLPLDGGPPAVLMLVSRHGSAFPPAEVDVVGGLGSHLSASLHAARLNDQLQDAFDELQRTHDYLVKSEMLRVAGEMASGVAHEFNNVLGAILGRAQLLSLRGASGNLSTEELLESLAVIERAALDGRETGRRLRQFGKAQESAVFEPLDLDRSLRDAVEFTRPRWENEAHGAGHHIEVSVDSRPGVFVRGRGHEMREVFTNLILNAVDALPQGGHIRLSALLEHGRVTAAVEDDGQGMSEETRLRLFEPFYSTKGPAGTGLGLSLVYGIVQRCEGTIEVTTRPGHGTRIAISFPPAEAAAPPPVPADSGDPAARERPLDVMVVDDEPAVRDVLRDMAMALGHRVVACASGQEGLERYLPGGFQLVLTDLGMPGVTGWKLAEAIRVRDPEVVIAFVTGWGEEVKLEAARMSGADMVITKPFSIEDVIRATQLASSRCENREAA